MTEKQAAAYELYNELQGMSYRYYGLYSDMKEHKRVLEQLDKMEDGRTAYRLIGDVLAKQTVGEVKPVLQEMIYNLENVLQQMEKMIESKSREFAQLTK